MNSTEEPGPSVPELLPPRLEVRPKVLRKAVIFSVLLVIMVAACLVLIFCVQKPVALVAGLAGLLLFGAMGIYGLAVVIPRYLRRPVSLVLSQAGLERLTSVGGALIPWEDVAEVGLLKMSGNYLVGLRLWSYDRYLAALNPEMLAEMKKTAAFGKVLNRLAGAGISWESPEPGQLWSRLAGVADPARELAEAGDLGAQAEMLLVSRYTWGYDMLLSWCVDRPAPEMAVLMEAYRQKRP
ncbi:MAG: hypothetical protein FJ134_15255 [Deltaproteobacteria bacterium]|nr:hypothetical protein [Deltaproteobacteria bacterium]